MNLNCPRCLQHYNDRIEIETVDKQHEIKRIQDSDDLNADPKADDHLIELWYCAWCGHYFRAYYELVKIIELKETPTNEIETEKAMEAK